MTEPKPARRPRVKPPESSEARETPTFVPARNFTIPLAERVRGAGGPPAYAVRLRTIEDLETSLVEALRDHLDEGDDETLLARAARDRDIARELAEMNRLIASHNRFFPVEANLPMEPVTGRLLERGRPWQPRSLHSLETLLAATRACLEGERDA